MFGIFRVVAGSDKGRTITVVDGQTITIGAGDQCHSILNDAQIAEVHCQVECNNGVVLLSAAQQDRPTLVNRQTITQQELKAGDLIELGATKLTFLVTNIDEESTLEGRALPS